MRFSLRLIVIIMMIGMIIFLGLNLTDSYDLLNDSTFISPAQGTIRINTNIYYVYDHALRTEVRRIVVTNSNYETAIVETLKKGSNNPYYKSIFDYDVEILSIELINNTCYINFSSEFTKNVIWSDEDFDLYLWSIINSLTENKRVQNVQFLVEGQQLYINYHSYSLSEPLPRLESLIYTKAHTASDTVLEFLDDMSASRFDFAYSLLTEASIKKFEYSDFIKYANQFNESHFGYSRELNYTKISLEEFNVLIKFTKKYESDGLELHYFEMWKVITENNVFRIELINAKP